MTPDIQQQIINEFGSQVTQEAYIKNAERGLWDSEKIVVKKYFSPKSTVLDVGCGTGRTTIPLHELGYKVVGADITPEMIQNAQKIAGSKNLDIVYEVGDATNLKYEDNSFDNAIFSNNGWTQIPEHEKREKALKEIYRILKPGGYFIFTTHIRSLKSFKLFWVTQWIKFYILKPLGFKIKEVDFGDRFFKRESGGTKFDQEQFIHIPNVNVVKKQIREAGFDLVLAKIENEITKQNLHNRDNVHNYYPMFYVCRK